MQLGFVSAILPDLDLAEVFEFGSNQGYECVEVMCWPKGKAERRYAGVTHIEAEKVDENSSQISELVEKNNIKISGGTHLPSIIFKCIRLII